MGHKEIGFLLVTGLLGLYGVSETGILKTVLEAFRDTLSSSPQASLVLTVAIIVVVVSPFVALVKRFS